MSPTLEFIEIIPLRSLPAQLTDEQLDPARTIFWNFPMAWLKGKSMKIFTGNHMVFAPNMS